MDLLADFPSRGFHAEFAGQGDLRSIDFQDDIPGLQIAGFHRGAFQSRDDNPFRHQLPSL